MIQRKQTKKSDFIPKHKHNQTVPWQPIKTRDPTTTQTNSRWWKTNRYVNNDSTFKESKPLKHPAHYLYKAFISTPLEYKTMSTFVRPEPLNCLYVYGRLCDGQVTRPRCSQPLALRQRGPSTAFPPHPCQDNWKEDRWLIRRCKVCQIKTIPQPTDDKLIMETSRKFHQKYGKSSHSSVSPWWSTLKQHFPPN